MIYSRNIVKLLRKRGFGGNAPNKLKVYAEGRGRELVSDPCRRHGQKLVDGHPTAHLESLLTNV